MKKITLLVILIYIINLVLVLLIDEDINKLISILFISIIYAALYICIIKIYRKTKRADNILFFAFIIIITMQGLIFFNYKNTVSSIEIPRDQLGHNRDSYRHQKYDCCR